MKDRQPTQVLDNGAIRYGIYNADGTLDHYEYLKREDAPTVEGTPLSKANLLSDATAAKIWRGEEKPDDPTVNDALAKLSDGTAKIGDVLITGRTNLSDAWLPCDGRSISNETYPDLFNVLRTDVDYTTWDTLQIATEGGSSALACILGQWFFTYATNDGICIARSTDLVNFQTTTLPKALFTASVSTSESTMLSPFGEYAIPSRIIYCNGRYMFAVSLTRNTVAYTSIAYTDDLAEDWSVVYCGKATVSNYTYNCEYCNIFYNNNIYWVITGMLENHYTASFKSIDAGISWTQSSMFFNGDEYQIHSLCQAEVPGPIYSLDQRTADNRALCKTYDFSTIVRVAVQDFKNTYSTICAHGSTVIIFGANMYAYSLDEGQTLTYKTYFEDGDYFRTFSRATSYYDGNICIAVLRGALNSDSSTNIYKLAITNDITDQLHYIQGPTLPGMITSKGNVYAMALYHGQTLEPITAWTKDYTYADKRIPTITPGLRSAAYIKALEE